MRITITIGTPTLTGEKTEVFFVRLYERGAQAEHKHVLGQGHIIKMIMIKKYM